MFSIFIHFYSRLTHHLSIALVHYKFLLATTQHHSAPGGHQRCCSSGTPSQKVRPHLSPDARWASVA